MFTAGNEAVAIGGESPGGRVFKSSQGNPRRCSMAGTQCSLSYAVHIGIDVCLVHRTQGCCQPVRHLLILALEPRLLQLLLPMR